MNLTEHFALHEFDSPDGAEMVISVQENLRVLCAELEKIRKAFGGVPLHISKDGGGFRSPEVNARIPGAAPHSLHLSGLACDFTIRRGTFGFRHRDAARAIVALINVGAIKDGGVGCYSAHVHYDLGPPGRRWGFDK